MHCRPTNVMKDPAICLSVMSPSPLQLSMLSRTELAHQTQSAKPRVLIKHLRLMPHDGHLHTAPAARAAAAWIRSSLSCPRPLLSLSHTVTSPSQQARTHTQWGQCAHRGLLHGQPGAQPMTAVRHARISTWFRMAKQQEWLS